MTMTVRITHWEGDNHLAVVQRDDDAEIVLKVGESTDVVIWDGATLAVTERNVE